MFEIVGVVSGAEFVFWKALAFLACEGHAVVGVESHPAQNVVICGGVSGDHDNDGVKNLVEYALIDGGERGVLSGNTITFSKRLAPYGTDLTYDIESSTGLTSWSVLAKPPLVETAGAISYTFTLGSPVKNFARLKVVQVP